MKVYKRTGSPNYYVRFSVGGRQFKKSLRTRDRRVADVRAAELYVNEARRQLGLLDDQIEHAKRPLSEHIDDFEAMLRAKGVTPAHRRERVQHLEDFSRFRGAIRLADLGDGIANAWIPALRERLSARSVNKRIATLRQFGRWLRRSRRLPHNPFEILSLQNEEADRRHVRRSLSPQEFHALIGAARSRPVEQAKQHRIHAGVTEKEWVRLSALGQARAMVYLLAAGAGLRRTEIYRLRWQDVDLAELIIRLPATKSGRAQAVPLHPELSVELKRFRGDRGGADTVIPERCFPNAQTVTNDLEAAGIPKRDEQGRTVDLHALRGTMLTWLKDANVHPAVAQRAARHAKVDTTIRHYTHVVDAEVRAALERVQLLPKKAGGRNSNGPRNGLDS